MRPRLFMPRYWPTWTGIGLSYLLSLLPFTRLVTLGRAMGSAFRCLTRDLVCIARHNIQLCLPELRAATRERLLEKHFESLGMAVMEISLAWWSPPEKLGSIARIEGIEHLHAALSRGRGALLLTAHFTPIELAGRMLASVCPVPLGFVCAQTGNEALAYVRQRFRSGCGGYAIASDDVPSLVAALRRNECVWCAPDQADGAKGVQLVPMFGIPTASNTLILRIARTTGAAVVPYFFQRLPGARGYLATIHPPLEGFPSEPAARDSQCFNRMIEAQVRAAPEQYLWIRRRLTGLSGDPGDRYDRR